jgi:hypothetical protein
VQSKRDFFQLIASGVVLSGAGTQLTLDFMATANTGDESA